MCPSAQVQGARALDRRIHRVHALETLPQARGEGGVRDEAEGGAAQCTVAPSASFACSRRQRRRRRPCRNRAEVQLDLRQQRRRLPIRRRQRASRPPPSTAAALSSPACLREARGDDASFGGSQRERGGGRPDAAPATSAFDAAACASSARASRRSSGLPGIPIAARLQIGPIWYWHDTVTTAWVKEYRGGGGGGGDEAAGRHRGARVSGCETTRSLAAAGAPHVGVYGLAGKSSGTGGRQIFKFSSVGQQMVVRWGRRLVRVVSSWGYWPALMAGRPSQLGAGGCAAISVCGWPLIAAVLWRTPDAWRTAAPPRCAYRQIDVVLRRPGHTLKRRAECVNDAAAAQQRPSLARSCDHAVLARPQDLLTWWRTSAPASRGDTSESARSKPSTNPNPPSQVVTVLPTRPALWLGASFQFGL